MPSNLDDRIGAHPWEQPVHKLRSRNDNSNEITFRPISMTPAPQECVDADSSANSSESPDRIETLKVLLEMKDKRIEHLEQMLTETSVIYSKGMPEPPPPSAVRLETELQLLRAHKDNLRKMLYNLQEEHLAMSAEFDTLINNLKNELENANVELGELKAMIASKLPSSEKGVDPPQRKRNRTVCGLTCHIAGPHFGRKKVVKVQNIGFHPFHQPYRVCNQAVKLCLRSDPVPWTFVEKTNLSRSYLSRSQMPNLEHCYVEPSQGMSEDPDHVIKWCRQLAHPPSLLQDENTCPHGQRNGSQFSSSIYTRPLNHLRAHSLTSVPTLPEVNRELDVEARRGRLLKSFGSYYGNEVRSGKPPSIRANVRHLSPGPWMSTDQVQEFQTNKFKNSFDNHNTSMSKVNSVCSSRWLFTADEIRRLLR